MAEEEDGIFIGDGTAGMRIHGEIVADMGLDDIERLIVLHHADAVFHGEEPFYVLLGGEDVWVIPEATAGLSRFLSRIGPRLETEGRLARGACAAIPWSWRRRLFGILPAFPVPRLSRHPRSSCPNMADVEPIGVHDLPDVLPETQR